MHHQQIIFEILRLIADYRYLIIFPLATIEGPLVAVVAGALAASGDIDPVIVFLILCAADLVGDVGYYALGRFGHTKFLKPLITALDPSGERITGVERALKEHEVKFLLFGKTQAFGSVILYACGALRMRFGRYMFWNALATVPKVLLFELIGYYFGQTLLRATHIFDAVALTTAILAILLLVLFFLIRRSAEREFEGAMKSDS